MPVSKSLASAFKKKSTSSSLLSKLKSSTAKPKTYNTTLYRPATGAVKKAGSVKPSSGGSGGSGSGNGGGYSYRKPSYSQSRVNTGSRSGGVGGSAAGSGGVMGPVGWAPTGAATKYLESAADMFMKDPTIMLRELATERFGQEGGEQIFGQLAPTIANANPLFLASMGQDAGTGTNVEWINYLDALINQQLTPGQFFNYADAAKNLFGAVEGSPLRGFLTTGDALEQGKNFSRILDPLLETGMHGLMAQGIQNQIEKARQAYAVDATKGAVDPFVTYLAAKNPNLTRLIGV